jgi:hypothetical protein
MIPFLTQPWALLGLLGLPALAAIYWLRNRPRQVSVSSLMLWAGQKDPREGGLRIHRLQTPLLFFLEMLALLLFTLAAAGPYVRGGQDSRALVVVLDDSYSMQAGGTQSPKVQAIEAICRELQREWRSSVRFVRAAETPQLLGDPVRTASAAHDVLKAWTCRAPRASLDKAINLAGEIGGSRAVILVVSDHAPPSAPGHGRLRWWAFGTSRPNIAFVNAARTAHAGQERCLLEIANLSGERQTVPLRIEAGSNGWSIHQSTLKLEPRETRRVVLRLPRDTPAVRARLPGDALEIDNHVTLLPATRRPVRVANHVRDGALHRLLDKALAATGRAVPAAARPELLFTDAASDPPVATETWRVRFRVDAKAAAYTGPFVLDRTHPLTEGLALQGVVWGAGQTGTFPGLPVIMAGNIPLVVDEESLTGRHDLAIRFSPEFSKLQKFPAWPILVWNLIQWRASQGPGPSRANVRLGEEAVLGLPAGVEAAELVLPDGTRRTLPVHGRHVVVPADDVGIFEVRLPRGNYRFAANALDRDESDLSECVSGQWGEWSDEPGSRPGSQNIAWVFLLAALLSLTLHTALVARASGRKRA